MIRSVVRGNLLDSEAQTLVNTVNCVGVMGKGIALQFKRRFPEMYRDYAERCARGAVRLGEPYLFAECEPWVVNFPTKRHWRGTSPLDAIERGLGFLADRVEEWEIASLAVPPLGCGLGGLEWEVVEPLLRRYLAPLAIPVDLYLPHALETELSDLRTRQTDLEDFSEG